jgi:hypothetical protein
VSPEFRPKAPGIEKENAHQSDDAISTQLYALAWSHFAT